MPSRSFYFLARADGTTRHYKTSSDYPTGSCLQAEEILRHDLVRINTPCFFFFQAEDGIRDDLVTGVQTCALPISCGDAADRSFRGRIKKAKVQSQRVAGEREHVTKLPAAQNPDRHGRFLFFWDCCAVPMPSACAAALGSGLARTRAVCAPRNFLSASRISGCFAPKIAPASSAALIAPPFPIATVA